jgi:hypothetical protein
VESVLASGPDGRQSTPPSSRSEILGLSSNFRLSPVFFLHGRFFLSSNVFLSETYVRTSHLEMHPPFLARHYPCLRPSFTVSM